MVESGQNCGGACQTGVRALGAADISRRLPELDQWTVERGWHLVKSFSFPDFAEALAFVNRVGTIAEKLGHHPDLYLTWGAVRVDTWTHSIDGLSENDFVLAVKIDELRRERQD